MKPPTKSNIRLRLPEGFSATRRKSVKNEWTIGMSRVHSSTMLRIKLFESSG
jgi:hypothetical protein